MSLDATKILDNAEKAASTTVEGTSTTRRSVSEQIQAVEFAQRQQAQQGSVFNGIKRGQFQSRGPVPGMPPGGCP